VIEDVLGARLRVEVLPLDRFAQTELVDGRLEVSINSRVGSMARVKDVAGVIYAAKWHESVHVVRDFPSQVSRGRSSSLPSRPLTWRSRAWWCAEAMQPLAIPRKKRASPSLRTQAWQQRSAGGPHSLPEYLELMALADAGGNLGKNGWRLLYRSAEFIGINGTVLAHYWQNQGLLRIDSDGQLFARSRWRVRPWIGAAPGQPRCRHRDQGDRRKAPLEVKRPGADRGQLRAGDLQEGQRLRRQIEAGRCSQSFARSGRRRGPALLDRERTTPLVR